jgi:hypothetical protein
MAVVALLIVLAIFLGFCFFVLAPLYRWTQRRQRAAGVRTTEQVRMADAMGDAIRANQPQRQPQHQPAPLSMSARLAELDAARQAGQITEAEYAAGRASVIHP